MLKVRSSSLEVRAASTEDPATSNARPVRALPFPRKALSVHFIRDDLNSGAWDCWVAQMVADVERYLACWAAFDAFMAGRQ